MKKGPEIIDERLVSAREGELPYTDAEISMILDTYMYTDYAFAKDGQDLRTIVEEMPEHIDVDKTYAGEYAILSQAVLDPAVGNLRIRDQSRQMGYNEGTNACAFFSPEGDVYVAFRGTADGEWGDNGKGLTEKETLQQKEALRYFDEVMEKEGIKEEQKVITTGHSKGGNKVQFITMESAFAFLIDRTYSVDGQGFPEKAIRNWKERYGKEGYRERTDKLYGINGENDFVSVLGKTVIPKEHIRYIRTPAEKTDLAAYHDIKRMFVTEKKLPDGSVEYVYRGRKNREALHKGALGNSVRGLSEEFMKLPPVYLDGCASTAMQIAEAARGRKKTGIHHERAGASDLGDFYFAGLPTIFYSLFVKKDGRDLIENLALEEEFGLCLSAEDSIRVNYRLLASSASDLRRTAFLIEKCLWEFEAASFALPFCLDGLTVRKPEIDAAAARLKLIQLKFLALGTALEGIAGIYESCDTDICALFGAQFS
ncbi:MAG: DUF2974 domain-containing protein [Lachnospiraceae bacterium]|nr:DUF2974 domain-containing protein [Lachnospiraceae bacterium]